MSDENEIVSLGLTGYELFWFGSFLNLDRKTVNFAIFMLSLDGLTLKQFLSIKKMQSIFVEI